MHTCAASVIRCGDAANARNVRPSHNRPINNKQFSGRRFSFSAKFLVIVGRPPIFPCCSTSLGLFARFGRDPLEWQCSIDMPIDLERAKQKNGTITDCFTSGHHLLISLPFKCIDILLLYFLRPRRQRAQHVYVAYMTYSVRHDGIEAIFIQFLDLRRRRVAFQF